MSENDVRPAELAPAIQRFRDSLEDSRKKLLRDKSGGRPTFSDPEQLRQFVAQYLYPQMIGMVEMFGMAFNDAYGTAMSNARDVLALRRWAAQNFRAAGVDVEEDGLGVSAATLNELSQEFYLLGSMLARKLPGDTEVQAQYQAVAEKLSVLFAELQSVASADDDEDEEDEDGEGEDGEGEDGEGEDGEGEASSEGEKSAEPETQA